MRNGLPEFRLTAPARVTLAAEADPAAGPDEGGRFEAIVGAVNQRIPRTFYDLVLRPGCADRSLAERGLPTVLYAHDLYGAVIGSCDSFAERDERFVAEASLFIEPERRVQLAYETWVAMTARNGDGRAPLREFSVGFDLVDARWETPDGEPINEADPPDDEVLGIYDLELYEFSPVLVGAARGTGFLRGLDRDELLERFPRPDLHRCPAARGTLTRRARELALGARL